MRFSESSPDEKLKCDMIMNCILLLFTLLDDAGDCGIPIIQWLSVYFITCIVRDMAKMFGKHMKNSPAYQDRLRFRKFFNVTTALVIEFFSFGWFIYGH